MASSAHWYNVERVSQPGSVILNAWRDQRVAARSVQATARPAARRVIGRRDFAGAAVGDLTASFGGAIISSRPGVARVSRVRAPGAMVFDFTL